MASEAEKDSVEVEKHKEIAQQAVTEEKPPSFVKRVKARISQSIEKESEETEQMHQDVYAARKKVTEVGEHPIVKKVATADQKFSEELKKGQAANKKGKGGSSRSGLTGFIFGRKRAPPLEKYYGSYRKDLPYYVKRQAQRPEPVHFQRTGPTLQEFMRSGYHSNQAYFRVGPQSGGRITIPRKGVTDNLPQSWGPTRDYRVASSLHLFGEWSGAGGVQSPIAKYGGGLPRFWDSRPRGQAPRQVGVNLKRGMFKRGVFG